MIKKKKKILRFNFIIMLIFLILLWTILYIPIKVKHFSIVKTEVQASERFNVNLEYIDTFKDLKESFENIYGKEESIEEMAKLIENIENKLYNKDIDEIEADILELKSKINDLSASNEIELENYFNSITDESLNYFTGTEKEVLDNYINKYNNLFKKKKYNLAKEQLKELSAYINETKKSANTRRIKEIYEEKSNEDSSMREPKYINGILLVNKEYGLPETYNPGENIEAREAFETMKADAAEEGIYLNAFSTYRSYWSQDIIYNNYLYNYGQESTDTFSARAGFSEHQTGLAFDIGGVDRSLWAQVDFQYTDEAKWLKENCTKYGFILRYPEDKEWITGYMYESWHFRYIGVEHSKNFEDNNLTLEEYLGL